jgi:hypothetical protein
LVPHSGVLERDAEGAIVSDAEGAAWTTAPDLASRACVLENGAVVADGRLFHRAVLDSILTEAKPMHQQVDEQKCEAA